MFASLMIFVFYLCLYLTTTGKYIFFKEINRRRKYYIELFMRYEWKHMKGKCVVLILATQKKNPICI